jgi:hypothetical protein
VPVLFVLVIVGLLVASIALGEWGRRYVDVAVVGHSDGAEWENHG